MALVERDGLWAEELGEGPLPDDAIVLSRLLRDRFSCRAYQSRPVSRPVIRQMLGIAQMSASWCNSQPWQVIVTEGDRTKAFADALFNHACSSFSVGGGMPDIHPDYEFPPPYQGIYKERQRDVGRQLYESLGIANGDRAASQRQALENFRLFGAPHVMIITSEGDLGTYGAVDTGIYIGSLLLAAQSLGIGMIPQAALATYSPMIREYFGIPENRRIVIGASFGYADESHPANSFRSRRASLEDVVQWETS